MILDKQPLPGDEADIPGDAPPSYDALDGVPPTPATRDEKAPIASGSTNHPQPHPQSTLSPKSLTSLGSHTGKRAGPAWYNIGPSARAVREVRTTLLGLLRDLVKQNDAAGALGVLESCADACRTYDLSLSALLQEQSVEGHTPLYWAIINRPTHPQGPQNAEDADGARPDLVSALLALAAPLSDATVDEIRLACLHTSDHAFFQTLRRSPAFSPLTGTEEILLGGSVPVDDVDVEDVKADEGAFVARFRIPLFQKRMRISGTIRLEFIAKGRLWELSFIVAKSDFDSRLNYGNFKAGSWVVRLALLPHSPPTWLDSRLVIEDPRIRTHGQDPGPSQPPAPPSSLPFAGGPSSLFQAIMAGETDDTPPTSTSTSSSARQKVKARVELRLKAREQLTSGKWDHNSKIVLALEENALANSLQFKYVRSRSLLRRLARWALF
ncbi:hypothetical protein GSI_04345 [Ganoderma sinense ZZ0214-1]|uniref:Uncharacterized protein n=1 Tax=Ganoderma sinense ZZ0214-1 TaxID=1077348 RepID=A0A2G8SJ03_9APHY|nr:hypothetical protein GSI_04345 [Ganoderma sinense ZZ0214-1]